MNTSDLAPFNPRGLLGNRHVQSLLNSSAFRRMQVERRASALESLSEQWILDGGNGIRLQALYTPATDSSEPVDKGLVILLHGWEGSVKSNYMLSCASYLHDQGYSVLRLNFRDHGDTHHLNEGIFHSCRINEVVHALADATRRLEDHPVSIAGYSLGGNFALRVSLRAEEAGIPLKHCVAVCPVIIPSNVMQALESGPGIYHYYFVRKWRRSLAKKQACFPHRYQFDDWLAIKGLREQTRHLVEAHTNYPTVNDYFDGYSIGGNRLSRMTIPTTILAAADDPVIPIADIEALTPNPNINIVITERGGHCGYLTNWRMHAWAEKFIEHTIAGGEYAHPLQVQQRIIES